MLLALWWGVVVGVVVLVKVVKTRILFGRHFVCRRGMCGEKMGQFGRSAQGAEEVVPVKLVVVVVVVVMVVVRSWSSGEKERGK